VDLPIAKLERLVAEAAVAGHDLLADGVGPIDLIAPVGQDHRLPTRLPLPLGAFGVLVGLPPVPHQVQRQLELRAGRDHAVVFAVGGHGLVDLAVADQLQRLPLPRLLLPPILGQHAGPQTHSQAAEPTAGVHRPQLPVIARQHNLGAGVLGVLEEAGELAGADHARLVHHQHRPGIQHRSVVLIVSRGARSILAASPGVLVEFVEEAVDGGDLLEPLGLQAGRRDPGRRRPSTRKPSRAKAWRATPRA
jgi:hypothetical protein